MSASEKLRALAPNLYGFHTDVSRYINALPQIVAVVEEAEGTRTAHHGDYWLNTENCPLCAALAALDEALEEKTNE